MFAFRTRGDSKTEQSSKVFRNSYALFSRSILSDLIFLRRGFDKSCEKLERRVGMLKVSQNASEQFPRSRGLVQQDAL